MFDKHRNDRTAPPPNEPLTPPSSASAIKSINTAVIGASITIKGDISGEENLVIAGKVTGNVTFANHEVTISSGGCVNADVTANIVKIEGEVKGDLTGNEKVVISKTGKVQGNIVAPRVTLEDGAKFKGSIDMDPSIGNTVEFAAAKASASQAKSESEEGKQPALK